MNIPPRLMSYEWCSMNSSSVALLYRTVMVSTFARGSFRVSWAMKLSLSQTFAAGASESYRTDDENPKLVPDFYHFRGAFLAPEAPWSTFPGCGCGTRENEPHA